VVTVALVEASVVSSPPSAVVQETKDAESSRAARMMARDFFMIFFSLSFFQLCVG
jgi:hypothetical protein